MDDWAAPPGAQPHLMGVLRSLPSSQARLPSSCRIPQESGCDLTVFPEPGTPRPLSHHRAQKYHPLTPTTPPAPSPCLFLTSFLGHEPAHPHLLPWPHSPCGLPLPSFIASAPIHPGHGSFSPCPHAVPPGSKLPRAGSRTSSVIVWGSLGKRTMTTQDDALMGDLQEALGAPRRGRPAETDAFESYFGSWVDRLLGSFCACACPPHVGIEAPPRSPPTLRPRATQSSVPPAPEPTASPSLAPGRLSTSCLPPLPNVHPIPQSPVQEAFLPQLLSPPPSFGKLETTFLDGPPASLPPAVTASILSWFAGLSTLGSHTLLQGRALVRWSGEVYPGLCT